jgi:hypothetical protein
LIRHILTTPAGDEESNRNNHSKLGYNIFHLPELIMEKGNYKLIPSTKIRNKW